ncbi:hypothetical protein ABEKA_1988 [Acinetobacter lwoffii]|nr:hypothetical protein ABEKA_1988 [Acinetobacter lwoffii]
MHLSKGRISPAIPNLQRYGGFHATSIEMAGCRLNIQDDL